jgi:hypothetical protein
MSIESATRTEVRVLHNGEEADFAFHREELVGKLREDAVERFHIQNNPHLLGLFKHGQELPDPLSLHDAGVKAGDKLHLRPSEVRGG